MTGDAVKCWRYVSSRSWQWPPSSGSPPRARCDAWWHHQGIDVLLVVLVLSTAIGMSRSPFAEEVMAKALARIVVGATFLPALSWLVAHLVAPGSLRDGVSS